MNWRDGITLDLPPYADWEFGRWANEGTQAIANRKIKAFFQAIFTECDCVENKTGWRIVATLLASHVVDGGIAAIWRCPDFTKLDGWTPAIPYCTPISEWITLKHVVALAMMQSWRSTGALAGAPSRRSKVTLGTAISFPLIKFDNLEKYEELESTKRETASLDLRHYKIDLAVDNYLRDGRNETDAQRRVAVDQFSDEKTLGSANHSRKLMKDHIQKQHMELRQDVQSLITEELDESSALRQVWLGYDEYLALDEKWSGVGRLPVPDWWLLFYGTQQAELDWEHWAKIMYPEYPVFEEMERDFFEPNATISPRRKDRNARVRANQEEDQVAALHERNYRSDYATRLSLRLLPFALRETLHLKRVCQFIAESAQMRDFATRQG
jgi:hypothetical protein